LIITLRIKSNKNITQLQYFLTTTLSIWWTIYRLIHQKTKPCT